MSLLKRAFLSVIRKMGKSLLLALIIFVVATLVLCGLASLDAEAKKSEELRGTTGSGFTVKSKETWGDPEEDQGAGNFSSDAQTEPITPEMIKKIMEVDGLKAYNGSHHGVFGLYDENGRIYRNDFANKTNDDEWFMNSFQGNFCSNTEYNSMFLKREVELVEGRHITESDKNAIIISRTLADKLGLKVGDKVMARINPENNDPSVPYTITGLFDVLADEGDPKNNMENMTEDDLYGGYSYYWFADVNGMDTLLQNYIDDKDSMKEGYTSTDFYVTDPKNLEQVIREVQDISAIDWDDFEIIANDEVYERSGSSMSDISFLIRTLLIIIVIISMCIVTLILNVWIKSRTRETGILLAAGIRKSSILLQHILEVAMIAVCSFPLAYIFSKVIAGSVGELLGKTDVIVTLEHFKPVCVFGSLLLIVAVLLSSIPAMRQKPNRILSRMS